ncbi:glycosyltransferase [Butyrivibrio sp. YAB3001]|uniref:glycosyltransferase n=1 Tax=Butyrivibrio sp. YAB3001 TaxID=1520812 RepID=UPI0008F6863C|nr:glycosyltransferase [Butyrivibrio sp. YAB3001]SFC17322.1 Glycosyltransferase involved in cell wall bisynthesis [Butyrivibrio sp. YAB3001]
MKVLWLCNIMLPAYAKVHGIEYSPREGWLSGCFDKITRDKKSDREIELGVCFPATGAIASSKEVIDDVTYYGFIEDLEHPEKYDDSIELRLKEIVDDFKPDVLHIFGTEFPHTLAMLKVFGKPERVLLGIQGICGKIAEEYMADIPEEVQKNSTFRDRLKSDSILQQREKYFVRARRETESIRLVGNITGRTAFDKEETARINPDARYYKMNETMRSSFYEGKWEEKGAIPHSIFIPQGDYPLKGFHFMLKAMPEILSKYPDAHLYVAGNNIIGRGKSKYPYFLRASAYGKYIKYLISSNKLKKKVTMVGMLNEEGMKEQFLKSSVFVCPSVVENSPNSLAEAMLLGMPVVAARVGGIPSLIQGNKECQFFEKGDVKGLAEAILQIWDEPVIAAVYGDNARKRALVTHDPEINYKRLLEIYRDIEIRTAEK